jgi:serine/threonine protein kinase/WD40 repeat protein
MADWNPQANDLFLQAAELDSPAARQRFLDHNCSDPALRAQVESLLAAAAQAGSFLARAAAIDPAATVDQPLTEGPGTRVGPYKLLQQIGEGGMGVVYMAEQDEPVRRKVALKIIKPGMDSKQVVARFEAERQALSMMDHPNIARVLDAGTTDSGRPFFVMELVHGVPITEYCDGKRLAPRDRIKLFVPICQAIQHAHTKGIIHRDVKPSNVLVTMYDDKPVPKVIDFGVAKAVEQRLTEKTLFTQFGALVGTFEYMSPEQAELNAFGVDTRSDVYSLGVLLYELLAGSTPLERQRLRTAAFDEVVRLIKEEDPPRPSQRISTTATLAKVAEARQTEPGKLSALVRGELDWIVMKCLEKDRTRRYDTAAGLAKDVERYLNGDAVEACPPTLGYRLKKAYRKNRGPVLAASLFAAVLVAGIVGTSLGLVAANRARDAALQQELIALGERDQKDEALRAETAAREGETAEKKKSQAALADKRQAVYDTTIPLVQKAILENDYSRASALLASCPEELRGWEWNFLNRRFDWGVKTLRPGYSRGSVSAVYRFTADGKEIVSLSGMQLRVRDGLTGEIRHEWDLAPFARETGRRVQLSPDGRLVAVWRAGEEYPSKSKRVSSAEDRTVTLVSVQTGQPVARLAGSPLLVRAILFGPDGSRVATCGTSNEVRVWDTAGTLLHIMTGVGFNQAVPTAFTPDGKALVINAGRGGLRENGILGVGTGEFQVRDLETGQVRARGPIAAYRDTVGTVNGKETTIFPGGTEPYARLSLDGRYAMGLDSDVFRFVTDLTTGKDVLRLPAGFLGHGFLPDGAVLAINPDGVCAAFEIPSGKVLTSYPLPDVRTYRAGQMLRKTVQLSADGRWLILYHQLDGTVAVHEAATGREVRTAHISRYFFGTRGAHSTLSPDGGRLLTFATNGELKLWDLTSPTRTIRATSKSPAPPMPLAATPDGRTVATLANRRPEPDATGPARTNVLELVDLETGTSRSLPGDLGNVPFGRGVQAVFGPGGGRLVALGVAYGPAAGQSPKDAMIVTPLVWDVRTGDLVTRGRPIPLPRPTLFDDADVPQVAFAADGAPLLARVERDRARPDLAVWKVQELAPDGTVGRTRVTIPAGEKSGLRLSADGRFAALLGRSHDAPAVAVWDCVANRLLWSIPVPSGQVGDLGAVFSADGRRLVVTDAPATNNGGKPAERVPTAIVHDAADGRVISTFRPPVTAQRQGMSVSPDGRRVSWFTTATGQSIVVNADTGRELLADFDGGDSLSAFGPPNALWTSGGRLVTGRTSTARRRIVEGESGLRVWDGRPTDQPAGPPPTVDDWLAESLRLLGDPDPAKRHPARALTLMTDAVKFYPGDLECQSALGWALLQTGRPKEALEALTSCVVRLERTAPARITPTGPVPVSVSRRATEYFLLALATDAAGERERAKVWFSWGEWNLASPVSSGPKAPPLSRATETATEVERARAEPFRQEAARRLGLPAGPITVVDIYQANLDPAHPGNRLMALAEMAKTGDIATAVWATEFTLTTHTRPEPLVTYNAACVYALAAGRQPGHAGRAMELLHQAVAAGYQNTILVARDPDLDALRGRDDFKEWFADLERQHPRPEAGPPPRVLKP